MSQTLSLILGGRPAGTLSRLSGGRLRLAYESVYAADGGSTPLSVSMPLELGAHQDRRVSPWLRGLLPDNEAVIARWGRQFRTGTSAFALLGTPVGEDCAGAVQLVPPERLDAVLEREGSVEWLTESQVAARLRELRGDDTAWLGQTATGQFSLAGAQAKTALLHDGRRWGVPSGASPTSHILKPAVAGLDDHDLNEHLCLEAARRVGLIAARTRVQRFEDQSAIVVERYDRYAGPSGLVRIHQEDLCQALSVHPSRKYESEGGPDAADAIRLMRSAMPARLAEQSVWRFVDALIWGWLIAGTDAHAKNYSLLLDGPEVRLAPLYDVASALPYRGMHEKKLRLAMRLGRDYHVYPYHDPWPGAAAAWGLDPDLLRERVTGLAEQAPAALSDAAAHPSVAALGRELPSRLVDLVAARIARCRQVMASQGPRKNR